MKKYIYSNFWLMVIIFLPLFAIIFSVFALFLAFKYTDPLVSKRWYQDGFDINEFIKKDVFSKDNNISITFVYEKDNEYIYIYIYNNAGLCLHNLLFFELEHPSNSKLDVTVVLEQVLPKLFKGKLTREIIGYRNFVLFQYDYKWRITSQMKFPLNIPFIFSYGDDNNV